MKARDLAMEMAAAVDALSDGDLDLLASCGVDRADIAMGLVGAALIRVEGEVYSPDPECGKSAFITPCRVHDAVSPESTVPDSYCRLGDIVDLVAWHPARPARWALRTGAAEWLGCIEPQYMGPAPVDIRRSPLAWFRAGCTGLVPLGRSAADIYRTLSWCQRHVAEDVDHAAELDAVLQRPWPAKRVLSTTRRLDHAA